MTIMTNEMHNKYQKTYFSIRGFLRKVIKPGFKILQIILCTLCSQKISEYEANKAIYNNITSANSLKAETENTKTLFGSTLNLLISHPNANLEVILRI